MWAAWLQSRSVCSRRPSRPSPHPDSAAQATKAALSSAVGAQVESIRGGLELLRGGGAAAAALQADFASIDALCVECSSLIQSHNKIRELGRLHANLHATLRAAERIAALPREAAAAQRLLEEEAPLLQVYARLVALEGTSIKAQAALEAGAKASLREAKNLSTYFQKASHGGLFVCMCVCLFVCLGWWARSCARVRVCVCLGG